jgi:hypothetical protein
VRVLHSPINVAGGPGAISAGLREIGVESTLLVFNERPFQRGYDVNLELRDTSKASSIPYNLPKQLRALAWAVRQLRRLPFPCRPDARAAAGDVAAAAGA